MDNDAARFAEIGSLELERVATPTFVVHGTADTDVPPADGDRARDDPRTRRVVLDAGTNLAMWVHPDAEAAQAGAIATLRGGTASP